MAPREVARRGDRASRLVLLIDGDADSRTVYTLLLEHGGYEVVATERGDDGLRLVQELNPAVVVTEFDIHGIDGEAMIRALRADENTKDLCIIVVTTRNFEDDRQRAVRAGCTSFLSKPLAPQLLLREIDALIGPGGAQ